jgi:hypothetical protein
VTHLISEARHLPALLLALLLLLSIACGTTRSLRDAQDAFNDAATADANMQLRTAPEKTTAALLGVRDGGYQTTVGIIDAFSAKQRAQLKGDKLWGNALALKAMSQWRLEEYDKARETAAEATTDFSDQLGPRDAVILKVLDGLIALDQADAKLGREVGGEQQCEYRTVNDLVTSGLETIETERGGVSARKPVQRYLLQAKLAGHRTRQLAEDCNDGGRQPSPDEREAKKKDYCALEASGADARVLAYWFGLLLTPDFSCP